MWPLAIFPRPCRCHGARTVAAALLAVGASSLSLIGAANAQQDGYTDFWHRNDLTGNWDGLRDQFAAEGITFTMTYTGEMFANVSGGMKQGASYDGQLLPQVDVDLDKLLGWQGASFRVSMIQGHGPSLSSGWVGNIMGVSGVIAVPPATRLYNLWLEQKLFGDLLSVRAGIMNVDAEFLTSETASLFMNTTFGWPGWLGVDLPGGGPAYPLSGPGVRVRVNPQIPGTYIQAAVFSGDPTGHNGSNSLTTGIPSGTVVSFNGGAFIIAEAGYAINQDKGAKGPPLAYNSAAGTTAAPNSRTSVMPPTVFHLPIPHQPVSRWTTPATGASTA
jgi:porin